MTVGMRVFSGAECCKKLHLNSFSRSPRLLGNCKTIFCKQSNVNFTRQFHNIKFNILPAYLTRQNFNSNRKVILKLSQVQSTHETVNIAHDYMMRLNRKRMKMISNEIKPHGHIFHWDKLEPASPMFWHVLYEQTQSFLYFERHVQYLRHMSLNCLVPSNRMTSGVKQ